MSEAQVNAIYRVTEDAIHGFFKEHRWLSNFHTCQIEYEGLTYTSTEAAYQASKSLDEAIRKTFTHFTPSEAKKAGKVIVLRPNWEKIKDKIMYDINMVKYASHPHLAAALKETGNKLLIEDNWWNDRHFGVYLGVGQNVLGKILMEIRRVRNLV
jgi:ribA/ribD-fused uncharacterized protein